MRVDAYSLECIIRNLAANAVKFTPPCGWVMVRAFRSDPWGVIEVSDTGQGIPPDRLAAVKESGHGKRGTAGEPGAGFGLSLCHALVTREGGRIDIESEPGRGTRVTVRLPAAL